MTSFWQKLIQQARPSSTEEINDSDLQLVPLEQLSILEVAGDDASTFLQNLTTNDITALTVGDGQFSGLCNPKGRLIAYFLIIRRHTTCFQLILPNLICESIQKRLTMYVLRSNVTITNRSQELACIGLYPGIDSTIPGVELNTTLLKGMDNEDNFAIRLPADTARYLALVPVSVLEALVATLGDYQLCNPSYWELSDIQAGIAKVIDVTQEKFTPQQVNLDLNNSVSFSKGCYPGQEVVARLHYLGKPSRRLFNATTHLETTAEVGSEILTAKGSVAGHIVNIQDAMGDKSLLLSMKLAETEQSLSTQDGFQIQDLELTHSEG